LIELPLLRADRTSPVFFPDLVIAIVFFLVSFDVYYALAVGISTFGYLYVTIRHNLKGDLFKESIDRTALAQGGQDFSGLFSEMEV
jgi:hypothetical protein